MSTADRLKAECSPTKGLGESPWTDLHFRLQPYFYFLAMFIFTQALM
jgi:hypothetical protein